MTTFSTQELDIASDPITLLIKNRVMEKAQILMGEFEEYIKSCLSNTHLDEQINLTNGKISKGENYKFLPYTILDFPAYFTNQDVFAVRSMFYWGNFFSFTIHLKGKYLDKYGKLFFDQFKTKENYFFCVNNSPWEYHYNESNYKLMHQISQKEYDGQLNEHGFVKYSIRYSLDELNSGLEKLTLFFDDIKPILTKQS